LVDISRQSFPLSFFEENRARHIGCFTAKLGEVENAPCNYQINGQTGLYTIRMAQLSLFNLTTAFQSAMIYFDSPAYSIPGQFFNCLCKGCNLAGAQKHPFDRFHILRGIHFLGQNSPNTQFPKPRLLYGRLQGNLGKPYCKPRNSGRAISPAGHPYLLDTRDLLFTQFIPQMALCICKGPILACSYQKLGTSGFLQGQFKKIVDVRFTVSHAHKGRLRRSPLRFSYFAETYQPLVAFFLFNGQFGSAILFPEILRVSRPALHIKQTQRCTIRIESHRIVNNQSNPSVQTIPNWPKILRRRVSGVVKCSGILHCQYHWFLARTILRRFVMLLKDFIHARITMIKKTIGRFCFGSCLTGLRNSGLRVCIKVAHNAYQTSSQPSISKIRFTKFFFSPILNIQTLFRLTLYLTLKRFTTQDSAGILAKGKYIHIFNSKRKATVSILPPSATSRAHMPPIGCPITGPLESIPFYKGLQQQRLKTVTLKPILGQSSDTQRQNVRSQIRYLNLRQNQKATVTNHPRQMFSTSRIAPTNPAISRFNSPGCCAECQTTQPAIERAFDQISHLSTTKGTSTQIMEPIHESIPHPGVFASTAAYPYQLNTTQLFQIAAYRLNLLNDRLLFPFRLKQAFNSRLRQFYNALTIQFQQSNAATHLLWLTFGVYPVKPLTNSKRKSPSRNRWLRFHCQVNFLDDFIRKMLAANQHVKNLTYWIPCVQKKLMGHAQFAKGEGWALCVFAALCLFYSDSCLLSSFYSVLLCLCDNLPLCAFLIMNPILGRVVEKRESPLYFI